MNSIIGKGIVGGGPVAPVATIVRSGRSQWFGAASNVLASGPSRRLQFPSGSLSTIRPPLTVKDSLMRTKPLGKHAIFSAFPRSQILPNRPGTLLPDLIRNFYSFAPQRRETLLPLGPQPLSFFMEAAVPQLLLSSRIDSAWGSNFARYGRDASILQTDPNLPLPLSQFHKLEAHEVRSHEGTKESRYRNRLLEFGETSRRFPYEGAEPVQEAANKEERSGEQGILSILSGIWKLLLAFVKR